jgi:predicted small secreted protein
MKKMTVFLCIVLVLLTVTGCGRDTVKGLGTQAINVADQYLNGSITKEVASEQLDVIFKKLGTLIDQSRTDLSVSASGLGLKLKIAALKLYIQVSGDVLSIRNEIADAIGTDKK